MNWIRVWALRVSWAANRVAVPHLGVSATQRREGGRVGANDWRRQLARNGWAFY